MVVDSRIPATGSTSHHQTFRWRSIPEVLYHLHCRSCRYRLDYMLLSSGRRKTKSDATTARKRRVSFLIVSLQLLNGRPGNCVMHWKIFASPFGTCHNLFAEFVMYSSLHLWDGSLSCSTRMALSADADLVLIHLQHNVHGPNYGLRVRQGT